MTLDRFAYSRVKWSIFRKQYLASKVLETAKKAAKDRHGSATFVPTYRTDVARLSNRGGCMIGVSFVVRTKGTDVHLYFRATEWTWRHAVDFIFLTRLLQLVPEFPTPVRVHMHYAKLFLNVNFLPHTILAVGKDTYKKLKDRAFPRLKKQWDEVDREFDAYKGDPKKFSKLKPIARAYMWARGINSSLFIPTDTLPL